MIYLHFSKYVDTVFGYLSSRWRGFAAHTLWGMPYGIHTAVHARGSPYGLHTVDSDSDSDSDSCDVPSQPRQL